MGLVLETASAGGIYSVTLNSPSEPAIAPKVLYSGPDQKKQQRVYRDTKAHYEARKLTDPLESA